MARSAVIALAACVLVAIHGFQLHPEKSKASFRSSSSYASGRAVNHFHYKEPPIKEPIHNYLEEVSVGKRYNVLAGKDIINSRWKGIVFLFHGCNIDIDSWMFYPEEKRVLEGLDSLNLFPVAFASSKSQKMNSKKCWIIKRATAANPDVRLVNAAVEWAQAQPTLQSLPIYAAGFSSGGAFASLVGAVFPAVKGVASFIAIGSAPFFRALKKHSAPPLAMVLMEQDTAMRTRSEKVLTMCQQDKVPCTRFMVHPITLTTHAFEHGSLISAAQSELLYQRLVDLGFIDSINGDVLKSTNTEALAPLLVDILCPMYKEPSKQTSANRAGVDLEITADLHLRKYHLQLGVVKQVVNRAYGFHEASADHVKDALEFLMEHQGQQQQQQGQQQVGEAPSPTPNE